MKNRPNSDPELSYQILGNQMTVRSTYLASYVWIYRKKGTEYLPLVLDDNYFTLTPGSSRTVDIGSVPRSEIFVTCYELEFLHEKKQAVNLSVQ